MSDLRTLLQLMRFPAVFTALADILLGFGLTHPDWKLRLSSGNLRELLLLCGCSSGLYLAGMVLNDVFDVAEDRVERPERPIPSGRISLSKARNAAMALMLLGGLCAAWVGTPAIAIAGLIVVGVFLYDGVLKQTVLGPLVMGSCRSLNIFLGASAGVLPFVDPTVSAIAIGMGIYVMGVTWFARCEAGSGPHWQLIVGWLLINVAIALLIANGWFQPPENAITWPNFAFLMGIILLVLNRRILTVWADRRPARIQATVRVLLLTIIMLDAALLLGMTGNVALSITLVSLLIPALFSGRWIYLT